MIEFRNLVIGYKGVGLFGPFSLDIPKGTMNIIIGANGTGKSTLLHTVAGNLPAVGGEIMLNGKNINGLSTKELSRQISLVYTERASGGGLTVRELVGMGRYPYTGLMGRLSEEDKAIVERAMEDVGVSHKAENFVSDISDGERQKAMIARALAQQTGVLTLDEPTNFLDAASRLEVMGLIRRLTDEKGITVLLSTHDISVSMKMCDNVITILPEEEPAVAIHAAGSEESELRLGKVFANRGVVYDRESHDFRLG